MALMGLQDFDGSVFINYAVASFIGAMNIFEAEMKQGMARAGALNPGCRTSVATVTEYWCVFQDKWYGFCVSMFTKLGN